MTIDDAIERINDKIHAQDAAADAQAEGINEGKELGKIEAQTGTKFILNANSSVTGTSTVVSSSDMTALGSLAVTLFGDGSTVTAPASPTVVELVTGTPSTAADVYAAIKGAETSLTITLDHVNLVSSQAE